MRRSGSCSVMAAVHSSSLPPISARHCRVRSSSCRTSFTPSMKEGKLSNCVHWLYATRTGTSTTTSVSISAMSTSCSDHPNFSSSSDWHQRSTIDNNAPGTSTAIGCRAVALSRASFEKLSAMTSKPLLWGWCDGRRLGGGRQAAPGTTRLAHGCRQGAGPEAGAVRGSSATLIPPPPPPARIPKKREDHCNESCVAACERDVMSEVMPPMLTEDLLAHTRWLSALV